MPVLHLVAGPHGAGKTTLYEALIRPRYPALPFIRAEAAWPTLLAGRHSFVIETAFSQPSQLDLLASARRHGFHTALYIVCVDEPRLLIRRANPTAEDSAGPAPLHEVVARYTRTLALLQEAITVADLSLVFDGSDVEHGGPSLVASIAGVHMQLHTAIRPRWVEKLLGFAEG